MKMKLSVLGLGFSCLDIIDSGVPKYMPGGTCANVLSVLSYLGWNSDLVKAAYGDKWNGFIDSRLSELGVNIMVFKDTKQETPRIVQVGRENGHHFFTKCPVCGKRLITLELPSSVRGLINEEAVFPYDLVYFDRVSPGITQIVKMANAASIWTFYEPNSTRSYTQFLRNASQVDIVKFSLDRIPMTTAKRLLSDLINYPSRTKLVICSGGVKGIYFSVRDEMGSFSQMTNTESLITESIVDSSGAGDWTTAGLIDHLVRIYRRVTLLDYETLTAALEAGQALAKICCNYTGALGYFFPIQGLEFSCEGCCEFCMKGEKNM